jgi:hypothetical protein
VELGLHILVLQENRPREENTSLSPLDKQTWGELHQGLGFYPKTNSSSPYAWAWVLSLKLNAPLSPLKLVCLIEISKGFWKRLWTLQGKIHLCDWMMNCGLTIQIFRPLLACPRIVLCMAKYVIFWWSWSIEHTEPSSSWTSILRRLAPKGSSNSMN